MRAWHRVVALAALVVVLGASYFGVARSRQEQTFASYAALCENRFHAEETDSTAHETALTLRERVIQMGETPENVECRVTICRLELTVSSKQTFLREAFVVPARVWDGACFIVPSEDSRHVIAFLARKGHSLPQFGD